MLPAVPREVYESDQAILGVGRYIRKTSLEDVSKLLCLVSRPTRGMQRIHLAIRDNGRDFVCNIGCGHI